MPVNTPGNTWGLPRELLPWGLTIDAARCRDSAECGRSCTNNVFEQDTPNGPTRVARFHPCAAT